jgi:AdoMet-dependent heme synthase
MTSGTYGLEDDGLQFLRELGINGLLVTLFSLNPAIHDRITGLPGSWEILWRVLQHGQALGLPLVLNCIAMRPNRPGVKELHAYAGEHGIPLRLDVKLMPRWDSSFHVAELQLDEQEQVELFRELGEEESAEPHSTTSDLPPGGCGAGWDRCYITPQGEVWPCNEVQHPCGNLRGEQSFATLWQKSATLCRMRQLLSTPQEAMVRLCDIVPRGQMAP